MTEWESKGCAVCRQLWVTGQMPPELDVNLAEHASLHRCLACGTYWEQRERYADVVSEDEAKQRYSPTVFSET